jgi:hypothetical protein
VASVKRGKPLARETRLSPRRKTPRKSGRVSNPAFMSLVRDMPCLVTSGNCDGCTHAHHMGVRGLGQKCSDTETVPFCERHHRDWHDCTGPFAGKSKEWRRSYAENTIRATRTTLGWQPKKESDE